MKNSTPDRQQLRAFYDRFGIRQDRQAWYEDAATDRMIAWSGLPTSRAVLEIGCGTGRLAQRLLDGVLPDDATWTGVDISATMIALAETRTSPWPDRRILHHADVMTMSSLQGGHYDHVLASYVLDLMPDREVDEILSRARRWLAPRGRLCVVNLTDGGGPLTGAVSLAWRALHQIAPLRVGGCRPLSLLGKLDQHDWHIVHHSVVTAWGLSSEVLVAERSVTDGE